MRPNLVQLLHIIDDDRIESGAAGTRNGLIRQQETGPVHEFGVVKRTVEVRDGQVELEEPADSLENIIVASQLNDVFGIKTQLPGTSEHLPQLPGEGTSAGSHLNGLGPGLGSLTLQKVTQPLLLLRGPEESQILSEVPEITQQPKGETMDGGDPSPHLSSSPLPDDLTAQLLCSLPGGRQDNEPIQGAPST